MITIKSLHEIEIMAEGGRRLAIILNTLAKEVRPGITTKSLDKRTATLIKEQKTLPAFLGYRPHGAKKAYPATICISVNDVVVHGVPSEYVIQDGDLVKLDLGVKYRGFYLDSAITVPVGHVSGDASRLIEAGKKALEAAIREARPGKTVGDIGAAVERVIERKHFSIIRALTGHGIGKSLHEDPSVFNVGKSGTGEELKEGMVLAIEPMISIGSYDVRQLPDESYATLDGSLSAHFEHTVAITEKGPEILTRI